MIHKMKTILLLVLSLLYFNITALSNDLFVIDENELQNEFAELTTLETQILQTPEMAVEDVQLSLNTQSPMYIIATQKDGLSNFDRGSFAWGFCCCPVGIFVVLSKDDDERHKNAELHFVAGAVASTVTFCCSLYVIGVVLSATSI